MPAIPSALRALRASYRACKEPQLRDRLSEAIRRLELLYRLPPSFPDDDGDMRRRKIFAEARTGSIPGSFGPF